MFELWAIGPKTWKLNFYFVIGSGPTKTTLKGEQENYKGPTHLHGETWEGN